MKKPLQTAWSLMPKSSQVYKTILCVCSITIIDFVTDGGAAYLMYMQDIIAWDALKIKNHLNWLLLHNISGCFLGSVIDRDIIFHRALIETIFSHLSGMNTITVKQWEILKQQRYNSDQTAELLQHGDLGGTLFCNQPLILFLGRRTALTNCLDSCNGFAEIRNPMGCGVQG